MAEEGVICIEGKDKKIDSREDGKLYLSQFEVSLLLRDSLKCVLVGFISNKSTPNTVVDIVKQIKDCEGLTTLQLSGNSFGVEATEAIGECLARKPRLSRALWSDMFVSRLKSEIPPALVSF